MSAILPALEPRAASPAQSGLGERMCSLVSGMCGVTQPLAMDAQADWASTAVSARLRILRVARHSMAADSASFAAAISPHLARNAADTLVTELLPLLDACKFLEREAERLLAPRRLGSLYRPFWLGGVAAEVHREPIGSILVIGPANFPLFLPGVQVLQALAAGNAVTWKPGRGGGAVASLVAQHLYAAGLPQALLRVTSESIEDAHMALDGRPGKVVFTGSSAVGHDLLARLAETATPAVVELSGADAIFVMPSADLQQVAKAVAFGLRLNGGAVCMSPRRLFASRSTLAALRPLLQQELDGVPPVALDASTAAKLQTLLADAQADGAALGSVLDPSAQRPIVISAAQPHMAVTRADVFAPVISLLAADSMLHALEQYRQSPFALTASIFCSRADEKKARSLAGLLKAGTVLINDLIAPTADPRVPFGGRGASGYGLTRGAEGLLEMTAVKTLLVRRSGRMRHLEPTTKQHGAVFTGLIALVHGKGIRARASALWIIRNASAALGRKNPNSASQQQEKQCASVSSDQV